jgi:hypothetical protein
MSGQDRNLRSHLGDDRFGIFVGVIRVELGELVGFQPVGGSTSAEERPGQFA